MQPNSIIINCGIVGISDTKKIGEFASIPLIDYNEEDRTGEGGRRRRRQGEGKRRRVICNLFTVTIISYRTSHKIKMAGTERVNNYDSLYNL